MAACAYCNTRIFLGGKKQGDKRFCNTACQQKGALADIAEQLPSDEVDKRIRMVHMGPCPKCAGPGPVDVHTSYRIWSAVLMTSWSSRPAIACQSCGTKQKLLDAVFSFGLGWWGLPWGILMTPVQVVRNLWALSSRPDPLLPSATLKKMIRLDMAERAVKAQQA